MKTIAIDIKHTVFDNDTEAILYITKDNEVEPTKYIFAIPVITFSWDAETEKDLDSFFPHNLFGDKDREKRLLEAMKNGMKQIENTL